MMNLNDQPRNTTEFFLALKSSKFASNWKADISLVISIEK